MQKTIKFFLSFICLLALTACETRLNIVNGVDEREANEIIVYLDTKGITALKVPAVESGGGGQKIQLYNISVSEVDTIRAMSLLNQVGLPRKPGHNLLGIFKESGLVPSELQEKVRYQAGLAEQIASTIRKIDGVLDAEVQISFPEEDPLNPGKKKGLITASVYVKHSGVLDDPNTHLDTRIRRLVTSSVTGLNYDNVTIIPDRARFTEYTFDQLKEPDKKLVSVWSIIISEESVTRFRIIFLSLILVALLLLLAIAWVIWKVYPILKQHGGFAALFKMHSIDAEPQEKIEDEDLEESEEETEESEEESNESNDQNIDVT